MSFSLQPHLQISLSCRVPSIRLLWMSFNIQKKRAAVGLPFIEAP
ncbi:hypothetical protein [Streptomyces sp. MB09-02B]|nr:hypothetical protein [Streptomyces sp. MB09-02B]MDX3638890.1 hypothetical protein [Streptomyces sp. MB09-02B]